MNRKIERGLRLLAATTLIIAAQGLLGCSAQTSQQPLFTPPSTPGVPEGIQAGQTLTDMIRIPPKEQFTYDSLISRAYSPQEIPQALRDTVINVYKNRFGKNAKVPSDIYMHMYFHQDVNLFTYYEVRGPDNKLHAISLDVPKEGDNIDLLRAVVSSNDVILTDLERFIVTKEPGDERKPDILFTAGRNANGELVIIQQEEYVSGSWAIVEQAAQKGNREYIDAMNEYVTGFRVFDFANGPKLKIPLDPKKPNGPFLFVPQRWFPEMIITPTRKSG